ncbi:MAG: phosphoglucosamine mutase [Saccharofermentanales bacterium]|jgi:phosphoglucosamine mutase|nr:phosphoglucosamine mutase [Bacillota bacterium]
MTRLFGTDGVRGVANWDLTPDLAYKIGWASANILAGKNLHRPVFLVGRDTRISGTMLEAALVAGLTSAGADVYLAGVIPTPGIAYLTRKHGYDAGVVISASHNPYEHNGIKLFSGNGYKLSDEIEDRIEALVKSYDESSRDWPIGDKIGHCYELADAAQEYAEHLIDCVGVDLSGFKIAVDCANGASVPIAPKLFADLGAEVIPIGIEPDGLNINRGCGSTDLAKLVSVVRSENCDLGLAFDGDADRMLAVDEKGETVDGDIIMSIIASDMKRQGKLARNTLVATVMSNLGLLYMGKNNGIEIVRTQVGDRYVLEEMLRSGYLIGGEQSGHLILLEHTTTGDGMLSALCLLQALQNSDQSLGAARRIMKVFPQVLVNVQVTNENKSRSLLDEDVLSAIKRIETELGERGRIFVRASGTEAKIRVMVEGEFLEDIQQKADEVANLVRSRYGA